MTDGGRPNLLFLFTDEQRADTMAAYGNARIQTPNLNRLSERSTVVEQAYVTQPVCTPSRSTILTGLYPHTNGCVANNVPLPTQIPCFPEMLPEGMYHCGYFGKWHLGDEVFRQHGFDEWVSIEDMYVPYYGPRRDKNARSDYHAFLLENGFEPDRDNIFRRAAAARLPEEYSKPAFLAGEASRFIRENRDRPFALYVNFLEPHMPFFGPRDDQYDPADVLLPDNFNAFPGEDQPLRARLFQEYFRNKGHSGLSLETEDDWRRMIARYWGLCSLVDTYVGTILDALEACGLSDNTIVVYTSDHGDMMGSHRLLAKGIMFEEAIRVPLLIRIPGQKTPRRVQGPVSQVDLVPTLLDLMGCETPREMHGKSLRPWLGEDGATSHAEDVFVEWNVSKDPRWEEKGSPVSAEAVKRYSPEVVRAAIEDPVRTIITPDGWKCNYSPLGEHELYNLGEDPGETRNLASDGELGKLMCDLTERIRDWQDRTDDLYRVELPNTKRRA